MMAKDNFQGNYQHWYKRVRKANNQERVVQYRLRKATQGAKDQAHDCKVITTTNNVPSKPLDFYKTKFQKITVELLRKLAMFVVEELKGLDCDAQQIVIQKFLIHPLVQGMVLNYIANLQCVKISQQIVSNLKSSIT
jgi:hypothetical protein